MSSSGLLKYLGCIVITSMVMNCLLPHGEAALSCGLVSKNVAQCIAYLQGKGGADPSASCCSGIRTLNSLASNPADRKTACGCLKSAASSISGIDNRKAAGLPAKCGVNIAYSISPTTDCSKVS